MKLGFWYTGFRFPMQRRMLNRRQMQLNMSIRTVATAKGVVETVISFMVVVVKPLMIAEVVHELLVLRIEGHTLRGDGALGVHIIPVSYGMFKFFMRVGNMQT